MHTLSVSSLSEQIKTLLESSFSRILVEGELSRITFHNSGHIYFTLKDEEATISAVMFKANASKLRFNLQEGLKVVVDATLTLYKPRGTYQINCFNIEPSGQGSLALAYEQLKQKLHQKGYFEQNRKKTIPKFVKHIAIITSATGAALQDMLRVAKKRYNNLEIDIYDVLVQGQNASISIANGIKKADAIGYDAIVIGRGGGSVEDLWAFNEELVADAIYLANTPIVSAVGHEIDTVLSDYVADLRAPTPSAAMEMILPDSYELMQYIDSLYTQIEHIFTNKINYKLQEIKHLKNLFAQNSVEKKLSLKLQEIQNLKQTFHQAISNNINSASNQLLNLEKMIKSNHPKFKQKKGFAQISQKSKIIEISSLNNGDEFDLMDDKIKICAKVISKEKII